MIIRSTDPSPDTPSRFAHLRRWLIDPPASVQGDKRQHLQMHASLMLTLIPIVAILGFYVLPTLTHPGAPLTDSIIFWAAAVGVPGFALSYALGRMGRYHAAGLLAIFTSSFGPWVSASLDHHITAFMLAATILAGTLMIGEAVILTGLLNILLILLLPLISTDPDLKQSDILEMLSVHIMVTGLIYIANLHHAALEARRRLEIQAVQARLEHLLAASPTILYSLDPTEHNLATFVSQNVMRLLGYSPQEWLSVHNFWSDRLHPEDQEHALNGLKILRETGAFTTEYRLRGADGNYRWFRDEMTLVRDERNQPIEIVGALHDISQRKQSEQFLRESETRLRGILNATEDRVFLIRPDGSILDYNESAAAVYEEKLQTFNIYDVAPPDVSARHREHADRVVATGKPEHYEEVFNGRFLDVRLYPIFDEPGKVSSVVVMSRDITGRKQAEDALRQSEQRYRDLIEQAADGIFTADSTGRYIDVNTRGCQMLGYTRKQLLKMKFTDLIPQEDQASVPLRLNELKAGKIVISERRLKHRDGHLVHVELSSKMFSDGRIQAIVRDISGRKQAEDALRQSEHNLLQAQRMAHLGNWDWDIKNNIVAWSDEVYRIFGVEPQQFEATYEAFLNYVHPDDRHLVEQGVNDTLAGIKPYSLDHRVVRPDGSERIVHEQAELTLDGEGQPLQLIGTVQDITERKELEAALRAERDFAQTVMNTMGQGLTVTDVDGRFTFVNQAYANILGINVSEVLGHKPEDFTHLDDAPILKSAQAERRRMRSSTYETRLMRQSGELIPVLINAVPRAGHEFTGAIAVITDLTEQKKLENSLREHAQLLEEANAELERLSALKDDFVANVSHELRTPIANLQLRERLLKKNPERLAQHLPVMSRDTSRLARTIEALLQLSRFDRQQFSQDIQPRDLNRLVGQHTSDLIDLAKEKDILLTFAPAPDLPTVPFDAAMITQVLSILLDNAINYTPPGGTVTVETGFDLQRKDREVFFRVSDSGPGIPKDERGHIYDRFFRGSTSAEARLPGTGLGLAIAHEIVTRHKGLIEVGTGSGRTPGAMFTVYLSLNPVIEQPNHITTQAMSY